ncbi:hypothetical protein DYB32_002068 [Aphanomyces invadans]|uniref:Folate-Biopterin Transporter (FBT) Family n=1 Tax=Aphanomyces invadans TaxID=157072 RepID=A0A3R6Z343_9STRA|nr:hypothetical protein DYB32_002068 [Aphanomyces invadans]
MAVPPVMAAPVAMDEALELVVVAGGGAHHGVPSPLTKVHDGDVVLKKQPSSALRDGDAPDYTGRDILALLAQYISVGFMIGAMQQFSYPIFIAYYHMEGSQYNAATALIGLGWSLKVFVGILSDCAPILGYRRKSYMILGWIASGCCMLFLALHDHGSPYYINRAIDGVPLAKLTPLQRLHDVDIHASRRGTFIALVCAVATIAFVVSDVAADALVVEYAQREPENVRGRLQSLIYSVRSASAAFSTCFVGFCLNSPPYGGRFSWDMGMNGMFACLALTNLAVIPITYWGVRDAKRPALPLRPYLRQFWQLVQKRAVWQVMLYSFFSSLLGSNMTTTAAPYVKYHWAKVESINNAVIGVLGHMILAAVLAATGRYGTQWNWRAVIVATTVVGTAIDAVVQFLTIYDIVRNQWFYLGVPLTEQLPAGINWAVNVFVIVELAEDGNEGIVYGLLTTVGNLPGIFGSVLTNIYCAHFDVSSTDIQDDSLHVRHQVAYTYLITYGTTVVSCLFVWMLPSQKAAVAHLKATGGSYPVVGGVVLFVSVCVLVLSIVASLLSMFEATACLHVAGGSGC